MLTTHEVLASLVFASKDQLKLKDIVLLVDEIDMCAPITKDGYKGAEGFVEA